MSLRKSPTMTPARLAANRRSALLSTGPKTARGKGRSRLNRLRHGERSAKYDELMLGLMQAHPARMRETATAILTAEELRHPVLRVPGRLLPEGSGVRLRTKCRLP